MKVVHLSLALVTAAVSTVSAQPEPDAATPVSRDTTLADAPEVDAHPAIAPGTTTTTAQGVAPEPEPEPAAAPPVDPAPPAPPPTEAPPGEAPAASGPKLSGFVDATYNYNANKPANGVNAFHTYTGPHNSLLLNAAHLALTGSSGPVAYAIEVDYGHDAVVDSGDDDVDVQEAYVAYAAPSGLGFKAGKFVTFNGIEVIESINNPTISRGLLFGLAEPFTHVGGMVTYRASDTLDFALGAVNGWDVVLDNNNAPTFIAKVGVTGDGYTVVASGNAGPEQPENKQDWRTTFDLTGMVKVGPVDLWLQGNVGREENVPDIGDASWYGAGVQPIAHLAERLALGARAEVFVDSDGARSGVAQRIVNVSLTPAFTVASGLVVRGEARLDVSDQMVFEDAEEEMSKHQAVGLGEVVWSF